MCHIFQMITIWKMAHYTEMSERDVLHWHYHYMRRGNRSCQKLFPWFDGGNQGSKQGTTHVLCPSGFICSGLVKTTLFQYLCCGSFPAAFALLSSGGDNMQEVHELFASLSAALFKAQLKDLTMIKNKFKSKFMAKKRKELKKMKKRQNFMLQDLRKIPLKLQSKFWREAHVWWSLQEAFKMSHSRLHFYPFQVQHSWNIVKLLNSVLYIQGDC